MDDELYIVKRYRRNTHDIEAMRYVSTPEGDLAMIHWVRHNNGSAYLNGNNNLEIVAHGKNLLPITGQYVIKRPGGTFDVQAEDVFRMNYHEVPWTGEE